MKIPVDRAESNDSARFLAYSEPFRPLIYRENSGATCSEVFRHSFRLLLGGRLVTAKGRQSGSREVDFREKAK
jgi:hypothetical protein